MTTACDLWEFSLRVYPRPGVEQVCLEMQSRWRLDVNVLLYCCWIAETGRPVLGVQQARRLLQQTTGWQQTVIQPLRSVRLRFGSLPARHEAGKTFYEQLKATELQAEHMEQEILQACVVFPAADTPPAVPVRTRRAEANISACLQALGIKADAGLNKCVTQLIDAVFG